MTTNAAGEVQTRQKGRSAYPNPPPKHPISERLERVRTGRSLSKRAFWMALTEGDEYEISYEAVRNYHYDREPPPSYLTRVSEVFDVRIAWLVAGEGTPTEAEEKARRAAEAYMGPPPVIRGFADGLKISVEEVGHLMAPLWRLWVTANLTWQRPDELDLSADEKAYLLAKIVGEAVLAPAERLGRVVGSPRHDREAWISYITLVSEALRALFPEPNLSELITRVEGGKVVEE